jgi:hypothetical protein
MCHRSLLIMLAESDVEVPEVGKRKAMFRLTCGHNGQRVSAGDRVAFFGRPIGRPHTFTSVGFVIVSFQQSYWRLVDVDAARWLLRLRLDLLLNEDQRRTGGALILALIESRCPHHGARYLSSCIDGADGVYRWPETLEYVLL